MISVKSGLEGSKANVWLTCDIDGGLIQDVLHCPSSNVLHEDHSLLEIDHVHDRCGDPELPRFPKASDFLRSGHQPLSSC